MLCKRLSLTKISLKVVGGYFFYSPCICKCMQDAVYANIKIFMYSAIKVRAVGRSSWVVGMRNSMKCEVLSVQSFPVF